MRMISDDLKWLDDEIIAYQLERGETVHKECATDDEARCMTKTVTYGELNRVLEKNPFDEDFYICSRCGYTIFDEPNAE
jgi:rubrerythrin